MQKILAIGNSFSVDSTEHLFNICKNGGIDVKIGNLYIGGCSLERHADNIADEAPDYEYFINSLSQGTGYSANEVLRSDDWDIVTVQQASHYSGIEDTYYPYIHDICNYVKKVCPNARVFINQTWSYEIDSDHWAFPMYKNDQEYMYKKLVSSYERASMEINAPLIPVGDVIQALRKTPEFDYKSTGRSLNRDGFHLDLMYGRYAAAAVWYEYLLHGDITATTFLPTVNGVVADPELIRVISQLVHKTVTLK